MEQEHVDAIQAMIAEYCEQHGLVQSKHQLRLQLLIGPVMTVKVWVMKYDLDEVLSVNLCDAIRSWKILHENWSGNHSRLETVVHVFFRDYRIGDFCRLSEKYIRGVRGVGSKTISTVSEFLSWLDSRLAIGCTREYPPFPWEEEQRRRDDFANRIDEALGS